MITSLFFIAFLLYASETSQGESVTSDSLSCSAVVSCGTINITYPFHLPNSGDVICGYPELGLDCVDGNTPILRLSNNNNTVLAIDYPAQTLTVVDSDIFQAVDECPDVKHNVTIALGSRLQFVTSDASLTFLLGCRDVTSPCRNGGTQIGCDITDIVAGEDSYVFRGAGASATSVLMGSDCTGLCNNTVTMPVYESLLNVPLSNLATNYSRVLKNGFDLIWDTSSDAQCDFCERTGGFCSYKRNNTTSSTSSALAIGCICPNGWAHPSGCGNGAAGKKIKTYVIATTVSISCLIVLFLAYLIYFRRTYVSFFFWRKGSYIEPRVLSFLHRYGSFHPKVYSYVEVKRMTKSFEHELGQGGCGVVYKGKLPDGRLVAVKILEEYKGDEEFMTEVASIGMTCHVNVVTLLGFCIQGSKRALIYDYMPNGSLDKFIFSSHSEPKNSLSWEKLYDIAVGIARGLEYLHRGCNTRIVHFDIKPHNILLDENFCPKISDFGLAELSMQKESKISISAARGTMGYMAPEMFSRQFGVVSSKSDVYSYGMMLLEIVSPRENPESNSMDSTDGFYFPQWIHENLEQYCLHASDTVTGAGELLRKMIIVGLWCVQVMPVNRPSMSKVVEMLESSSVDLELPPN